MPDHIECAFQIGIQNGVKSFFFHHGNQPVPGDARIVYQNVDRAEVRLDGGHGVLGFAEIRHITAVCSGLHAELPALGADFLCRLLVSGVNHRHIGAHGRKFPGDGRPDAPGTAGDQGYFSLQHPATSFSKVSISATQ